MTPEQKAHQIAGDWIMGPIDMGDLEDKIVTAIQEERAARQEAEYQLAELFNALRLYIEGPDARGFDRLCAIADQDELRRRAGLVRQVIGWAGVFSRNPDDQFTHARLKLALDLLDSSANSAVDSRIL